MIEGRVLITGGDGYLGSRLARRYLGASDEQLLLWVRGSDENEVRSKWERLAWLLGSFRGRVRYSWGDLEEDEPFARIPPEEIRAIVHAAAVTRFNVDEATAQRINVEGTEKLLRFASSCRALDAVGLLSTVYSSGLRVGVVEEAPFDATDGFANHYERSKWMAENILLTRFGHLPWRIFRVATAIADDDSGAVTQQNAFHNTLKLFYYGLLSLVPGKPETPLYFVTARFVADAIVELMGGGPERTIYHVAHSRQESVTLGELIDLAFEAFMREEDFKERGILKPLYADAEAFRLLAEGMAGLGGGVVHQAVSSVAPFAAQLFIDKEIRNEHLASRLEAYRAPDARALIRRTCENLVRTRWGKQAGERV